MDTQAECLKNSDEKICKNWSVLLEILERFDIHALKCGVILELSANSRPEAQLVQEMLVVSEDGQQISTFNIVQLKKLLRNDTKLLCDALQNQVDEQFDRQDEALLHLRSRYRVYPTLVDRMQSDTEMAEHRASLVSLIEKLDDMLEGVRGLQDFFEQCYTLHDNKLREIWGNIQILEKYHNDNRRFSLARTAQLLSIAAIFLSILSIFLPHINNWLTGKNDSTNVEILLDNIDRNLSSIRTSLDNNSELQADHNGVSNSSPP